MVDAWIGRSYLGFLVGAFPLLFVTCEGAAADPPDAMEVLRRSRETCAAIQDFTAVFTKRERIDGDLRVTETVRLKLRHKPFSVYMKWLKRPYEGREVIYREGAYDGKMVGHQFVGLLNVEKRVSPESSEALKQSRRPITKAGLYNSICAFIEPTEAAMQRNETWVRYAGTETVDDRPVHVICRAFTKKREEYPVYMGVCYIDKETMVPLKIAGYDWDHVLINLYTYSDVKLNAGLTDQDFDIENPEYRFPGILPLKKWSWPFGKKK